jgi:hypothetical protein
MSAELRGDEIEEVAEAGRIMADRERSSNAAVSTASDHMFSNNQS